MNNLTVFCLTLDPRHEKIIKELSYIPVGLGKSKFNNNFFSDKEGALVVSVGLGQDISLGANFLQSFGSG